MHFLIAAITLAALWAWALAHQLAIFWVGSVLIERLPPPDANSGKFYAYCYSVIQVFAANIKRSQDAVVVARTPKP
jgi:hypothetical protein